MATVAPLSEPAADVPLKPVANQGLAIFGILLAALLPILDTTIANVAIPHMQASLGAGPQSVTWVLTSYIVTNAVAMPITGWLSDRIGHHRLFIISTFLFILTSLLCGIAQNLVQMVIFRALQGIAGAFLFPLAQALMLDISKPSKHADMMAILGLGTILGPVLGPVIGGWLTQNLDWRWVFLVNLPLGAIALLVLIPNLPRYKPFSRKFDMFGFAVIGIFLTSLQLLLDRGQQVDWFDSVESWIYLGICLCAFWMTVVHTITGKEPIFARALFVDRNFLIALAFMTVNAMVIYTTMALFPPMLQHLFDYDVVDTGLAMAPRGVGGIIAMQVANKLLARKVDPRYPIGVGYVFTIWTLYLMTTWSLEVDQITIMWTGFIQGLGIGLITLPMFVIAFATLESRLRTDASGLLNLGRLVGSSVGISVIMAFFTRNLQVSHSDLGAHINASSSDFVDVPSMSRFVEVGETVMSLVNGEINRQASMVSYLDAFWLIMWGAILVSPLVVLVQRPPDVSTVDPAASGGH
jgi:DHA2 family multidrug resistance protein